MSLLSRLFGLGGGGGDAPSAAPETHDGFTIRPEPVFEGGKWRIAATITKEVDGETRSHHMIRADLLDSAEDAAQASVAKARMLIDQQGERIFD